MPMNEKLELKQHGTCYRILNRLLKNPYFLMAPAIICCLVLTVYPVCFAIYLSFHKWDPITSRKKFVGLENFKYLLASEDFHKVLLNTIIYMLVILFVGLLIKVVLGVFLNKRTFAHNMVQTIVFTPHIIASVAVAAIFMWLMDPTNGIFNVALRALHLPASQWYYGSGTALLSVLIVAIWSSTGYGVLRVIAGLRSIPEYLYEAAKLDKAGAFTTFTKITIPMLSPTLLYLIVTTSASAFTSFDIVKMMTEGGPDNATNLIAYYVYQQGMGFNQYGRAMAAAVVLLIFNSSLSALNFFVLGRRTHYQ